MTGRDVEPLGVGSMQPVDLARLMRDADMASAIARGQPVHQPPTSTARAKVAAAMLGAVLVALMWVAT